MRISWIHKFPSPLRAIDAPLYTQTSAPRLREDEHSRSILNMLHRLNVRAAFGNLRMALLRNPRFRAAESLSRSLRASRRCCRCVSFRARMARIANQVFQSVYYFSARPRKDVVYDNVTYHRVAPPHALITKRHKLLQVQLEPIRSS